eukprot:3308867-Lingulodinium_polyedra.AAC.1
MAVDGNRGRAARGGRRAAGPRCRRGRQRLLALLPDLALPGCLAAHPLKTAGTAARGNDPSSAPGRR